MHYLALILILVSLVTSCTKQASNPAKDRAKNTATTGDDEDRQFAAALEGLNEDSQLSFGSQNKSNSAASTPRIDCPNRKETQGVSDAFCNKSQVYSNVITWATQMRDFCRANKGTYGWVGKTNPIGTKCIKKDGKFYFEQDIEVSCRRALACSGWSGEEKIDPPIALSIPDLDFGVQPEGTIVDKDLIVTNRNPTKVTAMQPAVVTGSAFMIRTMWSTCDTELAPGQSCKLSLRATFGGSSSPSGKVSIAHKGGTSEGKLTAKIAGAFLSVSPIDFGMGQVGLTSLPKYALIENNGMETISHSFPRTNHPDFLVQSGDTTCTGILPPGKSCKIGVRFRPSSNGASASELLITYGTKEARSLLLGSAAYVNPLQFTPQVSRFASTPVGTKSYLTVRIDAPGTSDFLVTTSSFSFGPGFGFRGGKYPGTGGTCSTKIPGAALCTLALEFAPTSVGDYSGSVIFLYDAGGIKRYALFGLRGNATPPTAGSGAPDRDLASKTTPCPTHAGFPFPWEGSGACTGNFLFTIPLSSSGVALVYNSTNANQDVGFGRGYTLSVDRRVQVKSDGSLEIIVADGRRIPFEKKGTVWKSKYPSLSQSTISNAGGVLEERSFGSGNVVTYAGISADTFVAVRFSNRQNRFLAVTRDPYGRINGFSDHYGRRATLAMSSGGLVSSLIDFGGKQHTFSYVSAGSPPAAVLSKITLPDGMSWNFTYYSAQAGELPLLLTISDPLNYKTTVEYSDVARGFLSNVIEPNGTTHEFAYQSDAVTTDQLRETFDSQGRIQQSLVQGRRENYTWDEQGNLLSYLSHLGTNQIYQYENGLLKQRISPAATVSFDRNSDGTVRTMTVVGPNGKAFTREYTYNAFAQVLTETGPGAYTLTNVYDAVGNLTSATENGTLVFQASYDGYGNPLTVFDNGETSILTYDANGFLKSYSDGVTTTTATNDSYGNLINLVSPGFNFSRTLDALGREINRTYSGSGGSHSINTSYAWGNQTVKKTVSDSFGYSYWSQSGLSGFSSGLNGPDLVGVTGTFYELKFPRAK